MDIKEAAAAMGRIGGTNGTGDSKRRSTDHYKQMANISWKMTRRPIADRFWKKVDKKGPEECWNWLACKDPEGYGFFGINGKNRRAHKVAYELHYKVKVKDLALHKCDNPSCCNPNHIFDGTQQDNMKDMQRKGRDRYLKGESLPQHKLTCKDVPKIRSDTRPASHIAVDYGVSRRAISHVKTRSTWDHVL